MTGYLLLLFLGNSMMGNELEDFARMMKITQYRGIKAHFYRNMAIYSGIVTILDSLSPAFPSINL